VHSQQDSDEMKDVLTVKYHSTIEHLINATEPWNLRSRSYIFAK
jgi:hypothetical protein